jgi:hypothetical protein
MAISTIMPGANGLGFSIRSIFTGTRWVILVKLPVAFSMGIRANSDPVAGAKLSIWPVRSSPGKASAWI